jgi:hypothetical protein
MNLDPPASVFGFSSQQASPGDALLTVSPERLPPKASDEPQANEFGNKSNTTSSEHDDESSWVKLDIATDN